MITNLNKQKENFIRNIIFPRLSGELEVGERLHIVREMERNIKVEF